MKKIGIMVCRDGSAPLKPGYVRGHHCQGCGKVVQISPTGQARIEELYVMCTPCGLEMHDRLVKNGQLVDHQFGPGAVETAAEILQDMINRTGNA